MVNGFEAEIDEHYGADEDCATIRVTCSTEHHKQYVVFGVDMIHYAYHCHKIALSSVSVVLICVKCLIVWK